MSVPISYYPSAENLGFSYNGATGEFAVTAANGTALSCGNPAFVTLPSSSSPGRMIRYAVTGDQGFIDASGSSQIGGNLFGLTTGVGFSVDMPFYVYAVANSSEDAIQFMITRLPNMSLTPEAAKIGTPSSAVADEQFSFFSFGNVTATDYAEQPCQAIGGIRMRMDSSDDWTVQELSNIDGPGLFYEATLFTQPLGQFGANAGTYCRDNGGTAAVFNSYGAVYRPHRSGVWYYLFSISGDGGTDGSGNVAAQFVSFARLFSFHGPASYHGGGGNILLGQMARSSQLFQRIELLGEDLDSVGRVKWSYFGPGTRNIEFQCYVEPRTF